MAITVPVEREVGQALLPENPMTYVDLDREHAEEERSEAPEDRRLALEQRAITRPKIRTGNSGGAFGLRAE